jgi:hypothetical protein
MKEKDILQQMMKSRRPVEEASYPDSPGLYTISMTKQSLLDGFAKGGDLIYLGKAEDRLSRRDLRTHFRSGATGRSTLRRSIGAILKNKLKLKSIPRSPRRSTQDLYNYKFSIEGGERLTEWMKTNLEIGFYVPESNISTETLRIIEGKMLEYVRAPLNLDQRTKHLNPLADKLQELRARCKAEAERYI